MRHEKGNEEEYIYQCAAGVGDSTASIQEEGPGSIPRAALQSIHIAPIPIAVAKTILVRHHYLHSLPGGTRFRLRSLRGT